MKTRLCIYALVLLALMSCKRMPLYDMEETTVTLRLSLDLDIHLDIPDDKQVDIEIERSIKKPEYHKVLFYSPEDGRQLYSEFVTTYGGHISVPSGSYRMLAYGFGTEYVQIRGEGDINTIEAFTSDITATKSATLAACTRGSEDVPQGPIIYAPDHLLVVNDSVEIPAFTGEAQEIVIRATCRTIVKTYSFEVDSVIGAQYIESCEAFVTNQARTSFFGRGEVSQEPATLCFPVGVDRKHGSLYTTFNTFGKLPGESRSFLHIVVRDTGGKEYYFTQDITEQFENPEHHIVIKDEIDIPKPETHGSGIAPTVDPWEEEIHDVPIG